MIDIPVTFYSYLKLIMLTSAAFGLEFCVSAGFVYIPSLLMKTGIEGFEMSFILSLAPLIAILTMPYIAKMGDEYQSNNRGRKPVIIALSVGVLTSLICLGSYREVGSILPPHFSSSISKFILILGIFGLDYCTQVCLNPFEALLSDIYKNTKWAELSYAIYSSMLALGSCVGYLIVAFEWNASYLARYFPNPQENSIFYFLAMLFVLSLLATLVSLKDDGRNKNWRQNFTPFQQNKYTEKETIILTDDDGYESNNSEYNDSELLILVFEENSFVKKSKYPYKDDPKVEIRLPNAYIQLKSSSNKGISFRDRESPNQTIYKIVSYFYCSRIMHWPTKKALKTFLKLRGAVRYLNIWLRWPLVLRRLFLAHLFMWTALMIHNLFYADYMGRYIFEGDPKVGEGLELRKFYDLGVRSASWGLLWHSLMAAIVSPLLERFIISQGWMSIKKLYIVSLLVFDFAMLSMILSPVKGVLLCNMVTTFTGITLAVVNSVPFILLSKYHTNKTKYYFNLSNEIQSDKQSPLLAINGNEVHHANLHHDFNNTKKSFKTLNQSYSVKNDVKYDKVRSFGIGADIAVLDIGYFLAQIIATTIIGQIIKLSSDPRYYMISALVVSSLGCYFAKNIIASESDLNLYLDSI
ncbi:unnamed protein product [Gordionus sp. m RMFG-2023]